MRWYASLRHTSEIAELRRRGVRVSTPTLQAFGRPVSCDPAFADSVFGDSVYPKIAIAVGRAVGGAVIRNRVRRRVRGALDRLNPEFRRASLLIVAREAAAGASYARLAADVERIASRLSAG